MILGGWFVIPSQVNWNTGRCATRFEASAEFRAESHPPWQVPWQVWYLIHVFALTWWKISKTCFGSPKLHLVNSDPWLQTHETIWSLLLLDWTAMSGSARIGWGIIAKDSNCDPFLQSLLLPCRLRRCIGWTIILSSLMVGDESNHMGGWVGRKCLYIFFVLGLEFKNWESSNWDRFRKF